MKRSFSPLVWMCIAGTAMLAALTAVDPGGVYADYAAALEPGTPRIAAVFTAVEDGVYPWNVLVTPEMYEETSGAESASSAESPMYRPLTDTVTEEEMRSSVGNSEPFPGSPAVVFTPSVETVALPTENALPEEEIADGTDEAAENDGFITVDETWFDDALFIGDSHIEGFADYSGLRNATYYFKRGLDIWSVMSKAFVNDSQTIPQALAKTQFGKIYIMLGINEIGYGTTESYAAQYAKVVAQLQELQPDALIYIQAIFHTSQKKSDTSAYNNDTINARNEAISYIADGERVFFVDNNPVFDDENGALGSEYSGDGVHLKAPYYKNWRDNLFLFGRELPEPEMESSSESAENNLELS